MIEVGKMEVNKDLSTKVYLLFIIFSFLLVVLFSSYVIKVFLKTKDYIPITAEIIDVYSEVTYNNSQEEVTTNYMNLKYEVNDKIYEWKQTIHFRFNKKIGNKVKIYIDKNNPEKVKDNYMFNLSLVAVIITTFIHIMLIKAYTIRKKI